ncbi:MAG: IS66 family transposase, partial [Gammaproteobacteria bacterium]|nr:IS66 family transposase [Gammaproteobacteria bacterium]
QLVEAIRLARHQHFGRRSEKLDPDTGQLSLLFNEAETLADHESKDKGADEIDPGVDTNSEETTTVEAYQRKKNTGGRRKLPDHYPRVEIVHTLDESDCQCQHCQGELKAIGEKVSEQIDLVPMTVRVIRHIRKTYRCSSCKDGIQTAQMPEQPIPGSISSPGTLAHVAIDKYINGLPLYRQEAQFKRLDIPLTRSTLANWMIKAGVLVQPLINLLHDTLLGYDIIQMDETRCQVLKEPGKSPQSQSFMWVQRGGPPDQTIVLYDYAATRSQDNPITLLGDYAGYLQIDGYEGYNQVIKQNKITPLGCMAHVRRKFDQALKVLPHKSRKGSLAQQALQRIQLLYKIEKQAKSLDHEQRHKMRQTSAKPVQKALRQWLDQHLPVVVKQSALGKAMHYMDKQWPRLITYIEDGRLNIDNNLCENAIRPFVIGRKNHLFSDTVSGAKASANLYSLIETAKANNIEPYAYLKQVFTELPRAKTVEQIEALLPTVINQTQKSDS